jgi:L-arabinose isomerase
VRTAVLVPFSTLWENVHAFDVRAAKVEEARRVAAALPGVEAVAVEAVASAEEGAAFARLARAGEADVVVVLQSMGVQPAFALAALDALPQLPVLVWAAHRSGRLGAVDHAEIALEGATVGTPMLTNPLVRSARPFLLLVEPRDEAAAVARVGAAVAAAGAAARLRRARIGRVGSPIAGYVCVDADDERLAAELGLTVVPIPPAEVRDRYLGVDGRRVEELAREVEGTFATASVDAEMLARTLRAACALEELGAAHALDAGAMNCHVPEIRFAPDVGIAPCFGLGRETTRGIPWTCAGDVVTAIAMLAAKLLSGAALYHELEAFDAETDEFVVANTGEHDLCLPADGRPELVPNGWFARDERCGACARYPLRSGPATLVAFTQLDAGNRLVAAEGEITGRAWPEAGTVNGAFRFAGGGAAQAWARWVEAGANHHSALAPGHLAARLGVVGRLLGVEVVTTERGRCA